MCLLADIDMLNWDLVAAASGILVLTVFAVIRTLPPSGLRLFRRWWRTIVSMPLLAACILWMVFVLSTAFKDSMGRPRNTSFRDHIWVYWISGAPLLLPVSLMVWEWRLRSKEEAG